MEIRADHQKGLSYSEIGRKYNIDRRTAKKYTESGSRPEYILTESKPSKGRFIMLRGATQEGKRQ